MEFGEPRYEKNRAVLTEGLRKRIALAKACIEKVEFIWKETQIGNNQICHLLKLVDLYLKGKATAKQLEREQEALTNDINNESWSDITDMSRACIRLINLVLRDTQDLESYLSNSKSSSLTPFDEEFDKDSYEKFLPFSEDSDIAKITAMLYSSHVSMWFSFMEEKEERQKEFWLWYLEKAQEIEKKIRKEFWEKETKEQGYEVETKIYYYQNPKRKEKLSYEYIQVKGMKKQEIQDKINTLLSGHAYKWIENYYQETNNTNLSLFLSNYTPTKAEVMYQSDKYLSVCYYFVRKTRGLSERSPYYYLAITINIETGTRVFLKNLVESKEGFFSLFQNPEAVCCIKANMTETIEDIQQNLQKEDRTRLSMYWKDYVEDCSKSEIDFIQEYDLFSMEDKRSFCLTPEGLECMEFYGESNLIIKKEYLTPYLKENPWEFSYIVEKKEFSNKNPLFYIQIKEENKKEDKINKILQENAYEWAEAIKEDSVFLWKYKALNPVLAYQSEHYFSLSYPFIWYSADYMERKETKREYQINITIEKETGKQVFLNEILKEDVSFAKFLKKTKHIRVIKREERDVKKEIQKIPDKEWEEIIKNYLENCSMSEKEYIEKYGWEAMEEKQNFLVTPDGLAFSLFYKGKAIDFVVPKQELKKYLKLDIWRLK